MKTLETLLINRGRYWGSNKTRGEKEHISQILGQNYFKIFAAFRGWEANDPPGKKLISYGPCIHTHQIFSWEQYCFRYICLYLLLVIDYALGTLQAENTFPKENMKGQEPSPLFIVSVL